MLTVCIGYWQVDKMRKKDVDTMKNKQGINQFYLMTIHAWLLCLIQNIKEKKEKLFRTKEKGEEIRP